MLHSEVYTPGPTFDTVPSLPIIASRYRFSGVVIARPHHFQHPTWIQKLISTRQSRQIFPLRPKSIAQTSTRSLLFITLQSIMGFSLFKKKNKDKAPAPLPVNSLSIPPQRPTASPQHLRAPSTPSIAGTPRSSSTPSGTPRFSGTPSALNSPALSVNEWGQVPSISTGRRIKLRCLLDPLANTTGKQKEDVNNKGEALKELFYITAELDAPVETLRHQIEHELAVEGLYNIGIFKASKVLPTLNES